MILKVIGSMMFGNEIFESLYEETKLLLPTDNIKIYNFTKTKWTDVTPNEIKDHWFTFFSSQVHKTVTLS
jgi:hypothetical protein